MNWKLAILTVVGLSLLEGVLANRQTTSNIGGAENAIVGLFGHFVDPAVPAFSVSSSPSTNSSTAPPATTAPSVPGLGNSGPWRSGSAGR